MKKIKKIIDSNKEPLKYFVIFFCFIALLQFLTPISGDDYGCFNAIFGGNIGFAIDTAKSMYLTWEGRFVSRIFITFLVYHKFLFNIITSLLICSIFFCGVKLIGNVKNKAVYLLLFCSLILLNADMIAQCYTWVAGSVTYLYPTAILIMYFTYIYLKRDKKFEWYDLIIFVIVNIIGTMFVENIGCSLVVSNLILAGYYYKKDKRKFVIFLSCLVISSLSLLTMLLSPGSAIRSAMDVDFNNLSLFEKVRHNLPNFIKYLFTRNLMLLLLITIVVNYVLRKKKVNILINVLFSIIPILAIFENIICYAPINFDFLNFNIPSILDFSRGIYIWYWIIFLLSFIWSLYVIFKKHKEKLYFIYFLIAVSSVSTLVMMILNSWGDRVTFFAVITLTIIAVTAINEIIKDKFQKSLLVITILVMLYYSIAFISINAINNERLENIEMQKQRDEEVIQVLYNPIKYIWNNNLPGDYFHRTYKKYLGIDENVKLEIYKLPIKEYFQLLFK